MPVTVETFPKWVTELLEKVIDKWGIFQKILVASASFCLMRYIYGGTYLPGDTTLKTKFLKKHKEDNARILQSSSSSSPKHFRGFGICSAHALRKIAPVEELLMHYENE